MHLTEKLDLDAFVSLYFCGDNNCRIYFVGNNFLYVYFSLIPTQFSLLDKVLCIVAQMAKNE